MHRIDHATKDVDLFGSGKHGFTEGTPGTEAATVVTDDWLNGVQEEICNVIESTDTLVKGTRNQLLNVIRRMTVEPCVSNWAQQTPGAANDLGRGATDGNITCFVERGGTGIQYTYDGVNFTRNGIGGTSLRAIGYDGSSYWVAVGDNGELWYTTDPTGSWTSNTQGSDDFTDVDFGNGYWCATCVQTNLYYKSGSPSGSWTQNTSPGVTYNACHYANGYWVFAGGNGSIYYKASDPTGSQTSATAGSSALTDIAYGTINGTNLWFATSANNEIFTKEDTPDGTWSSQTSAAQSGDTLRGIAIGSQCVVIVGDVDVDTPTRGIQVSFDGENFINKRSTAENDPLYGVVYAGDMFICVGTSGEIQKCLHVGSCW